MPSTSTISRTIGKVIKPGMKRKDLIAAIRERWPHVSKKKILRSAFEALIKGAGNKTKKIDRGQRGSVKLAPTQ
ncbi:hypothetical protein [Methylobacterium sp.]|uniref:hypothetical protein n=1 Tax=Methylobacterium sp. TaxID=409 RepID=UPI003B0154F0